MLFGTVLMGRWWYANPDYFPHFSASSWRHIEQLFGVANVDDAQNAELFVVIIASFLVVAVITTITVATVGYARRKN
jgi:hypothetical protein